MRRYNQTFLAVTEVVGQAEVQHSTWAHTVIKLIHIAIASVHTPKHLNTHFPGRCGGMCYNTSVSSRTSLQFEDILVKHPHIQHLTADYRADGSESLAGAKAQNMSWIFFFFYSTALDWGAAVTSKSFFSTAIYTTRMLVMHLMQLKTPRRPPIVKETPVKVWLYHAFLIHGGFMFVKLCSSWESYLNNWRHGLNRNPRVGAAGETLQHIFKGSHNQEVNPKAGKLSWRMCQVSSPHWIK